MRSRLFGRLLRRLPFRVVDVRVSLVVPVGSQARVVAKGVAWQRGAETRAEWAVGAADVAGLAEDWSDGEPLSRLEGLTRVSQASQHEEPQVAVPVWSARPVDC